MQVNWQESIARMNSYDGIVWNSTSIAWDCTRGMPSRVFYMLYVYHDSFIRIPPHLHTIHSLICVPWLVHKNAIPRFLCVICVPWLIHENITPLAHDLFTYTCTMTHSLIRVPWLIDRNAIPRLLCLQYHPIRTRFIHLYVYLSMRLIDRDAIPRLLCFICVPYVIFVPCCNTHEVPCHTYERVMSHICVRWLIDDESSIIFSRK